MSYRAFSDSSGRSWEVWLVLPQSAERRMDERRMLADRRHSTRIHARERRVTIRRVSEGKRVMVPAGFEHGWLCFSRSGEKRRLAPVPFGWENASESQLGDWCRLAKPVAECPVRPG